MNQYPGQQPYPGQNPYAAPQAPIMPNAYAPGHSPARVEGELLVMANGATFPPVCLKCGGQHGIEWRDQKFRYVPPWARYLFGYLIQALVAKRSRFNLPLCQPCHKEWKKWSLLMAVLWLPAVLFWILGGVFSSMDLDTVAMAMFAVGTLIFIAAIGFAVFMRNKKIVTTTKIDATHTWLRGIHANVLRAATMPQQGYPPAPVAAPYGAPAYGQPQQQPPPYGQPPYGGGGGYYPPR